jgi:hypothetical protein
MKHKRATVKQRWATGTGASACAPQVAAPAANLYTHRPTSNYVAVRNRIKDPNSLRPGSGVTNELAPVIDFNRALTGW